jgi:hypothetical protein
MRGGQAQNGKGASEMKWFYDIKIGTKLIGAYVAGGVITAVVGVTGVANMVKIATLANSSYTNETVAISYLAEARAALLELARAEKNFLLSSSPEERTKYRDRIAQYQSGVSDNLEKARPLVHSDEGKREAQFIMILDIDRVFSAEDLAVVRRQESARALGDDAA